MKDTNIVDNEKAVKNLIYFFNHSVYYTVVALTKDIPNSYNH